MSVSVCPNGHIYSSSECGICAPKKEPDPGWTGLPDDAPFGQEESDHTPEAFSPPTTDGDTNLTQPKGSGEQPTSVETDYAILPLCNCDGFWHTYSTEETPSKYLDDLVAEERRQAKIQELEAFSGIVPTEPPKMDIAVFDTGRIYQETLKNRLTELRGDDNE